MSNQIITFPCVNGHVTIQDSLLNMHCKVCGSAVRKGESETIKEAARSKYGSKGVVIDGIAFDSSTEGARYLQLRDMQKRGQINRLQCQHPIAIRGESGAKIGLYWADFFYSYGSVCTVIEDVKGVKTAVFSLKQKMLAAQGITIKIVTAADIPVEYRVAAREIRESGL